MQLTSSAFNHNQAIPKEYTCDGRDLLPPLAISEVPPQTKSLALIINDPDSASGDFVHWIVWNIPPETTELNPAVLDSANQGKNSAGTLGYVSPCPPSGTHHYIFKLYALDIFLTLDATSTKADLTTAAGAHILDQAELVGTYSRR